MELINDTRFDKIRDTLSQKGMTPEDIEKYISENKDALLQKIEQATQQLQPEQPQVEPQAPQPEPQAPQPEPQASQEQQSEESQELKIPDILRKDSGVEITEELLRKHFPNDSNSPNEEVQQAMNNNITKLINIAKQIKDNEIKGYLDTFIKSSELTTPMMDAIKGQSYKVDKYTNQEGENGFLIRKESIINPNDEILLYNEVLTTIFS